MILCKLFLEFFKVSCFTFGGAYGAITLIREMVLRNGWIDETRLTYMIAVSESTPGPILVNLATYIGSDQAGFWGSLLATIGVVLPAYLVILLVMVILKNCITDPRVQAVLKGVKPCVTGMILATGCTMLLRGILPQEMDLRAVFITAALAAAMLLFPKFTGKKLSPIGLICLSAVLGILVYGI